MGKSRKKRPQRVDYDELFRSEPKRDEHDWMIGITAMSLEDEDLPPHRKAKRAAAAAGAAKADAAAGSSGAAAQAATAAGGDGEGMDTTDAAPLIGKKRRKQALKAAAVPMKSTRGQKTTAQRKRKSDKQEKALARAEKAAVKVTKRGQKKLQVAALKALY